MEIRRIFVELSVLRTGVNVLEHFQTLAKTHGLGGLKTKLLVFLYRLAVHVDNVLSFAYLLPDQEKHGLSVLQFGIFNYVPLVLLLERLVQVH